MIVGLHHIALSVADLDMTFHAAPVRLGASAAIYGRDPFGTIIELYEVGGPHGLEHTAPAP